MKRERLYMFDTTLRDGNQSQGVAFTVEDKRAIAQALDGIGIDYIEGGWPGANPTDTDFFAKPPKLKRAKLTAFGMTRRPGRSVSNDPGLKAVLDAEVPAACLVGKTWDWHVELALGTTQKEAVKVIADSIAAAVTRGREAMLDCEHFFDGYKANSGFALECAIAALEAGARWIVLCDTNGGTLPHEVERIVTAVAKVIPGDRLGIHAQNDTDNAVANSLAAVRAGVRHVQGTLNGIGERCGNANLVSIIPTLLLKPDFAEHYETGVGSEGLRQLTHVSRLLDERLNRAPNTHAPYVGDAAFAHKGGLHGSAVAKDPRTYEHVSPELVGNRRHVLVSDQAGKANVLLRLKEVGIEVAADDPRLGGLIADMKEREHQGYAYDDAAASFELMALRALGRIPEYFHVASFRVIVERRYNARGGLVTTSDAMVKSVVDGDTLLSVGEGNGPVNALDYALRQELGKYSAYLADLELVDYKVRILTQGTGAVTRVMIESRDGQGNRWGTVGVSANIIDASFQALYDAIVYKLYRDGAPAGIVKAAE
ncbi:MAG: citramalate synthase [Alphaproteobacteria bacterium]|nr:citramalate synthase [Alphaproteobacteria bacterium]